MEVRQSSLFGGKLIVIDTVVGVYHISPAKGRKGVIFYNVDRYEGECRVGEDRPSEFLDDFATQEEAKGFVCDEVTKRLNAEISQVEELKGIKYANTI